MKHSIHTPKDLGLVIRAVRKSTQVRQDDLAGAAGVSRQFTIDVEKGKPTAQFGRVLLLLKELGISLSVEIPQEASGTLVALRSRLDADAKAQGKSRPSSKLSRKTPTKATLGEANSGQHQDETAPRSVKDKKDGR